MKAWGYITQVLQGSLNTIACEQPNSVDHTKVGPGLYILCNYNNTVYLAISWSEMFQWMATFIQYNSLFYMEYSLC